MTLRKEKKLRILQVATILLIAAFAIGFGACEQPNVGSETIDPVANDFNITGNGEVPYTGSSITVSITPKQGKSTGEITIYYEGIGNTDYEKSTTGPTDIGSYAVTFDVAASTGYNAVAGLSAGTLAITVIVPTADDFNYNDFTQILSAQKTVPTAVLITPKEGKSTGKITIHYNGIAPTVYPEENGDDTAVPTEVGKYSVTFDVAAVAPGFAAVEELEAPNELDISELDASKENPAVEDYTIDGLDVYYNGLPQEVAIVVLPNKSTGTIEIHYEGIEPTVYSKSQTAPTNVGNYKVTFDVESTEDYNAATGLEAGTLVIKQHTPVVDDFDITGLDVEYDGNAKAVSIVRENGKSDGAITIYYEGVNDTTYTKSTTPPTAAGEYKVTFDVAASSDGNWDAVTGLEVEGTLTIAAVAAPTTNYMTGPDALTWGNEFTPETLGLFPGDTTAEIRFNWYSNNTAALNTTHVRVSRGPFEASHHLFTATGTNAAASSGKYQHKVHVDDLLPGWDYQYSVSNDGTNWSPIYDYKVPADNGNFKFGVFADSQLTTGSVDANSRYPTTANNNPTYGRTTAGGWRETLDLVADKYSDVSFLVSCGDQVDATAGNETEYANFFAPVALRSLPVAPSSGNHDSHNHYNYHYNWPNAMETGTTANARNYYYLYNNILFVHLNTGTSGTQTQFKATFTAAKAAHPTYDWLIVVHHKSTASVAEHCADADIETYVRNGFETLMSEEKVDFVLAGHDHVYARSYPLKGMDGGKVSLPNFAMSGDNLTNPGDPIYLTFTTGSGLKYYKVSKDPYFPYNNELYATSSTYPYLGATEDGTSTLAGSTAVKAGNLPYSNNVFVQPYIPSYTITEVNGKTITFRTYAIKTIDGQNGSKDPYSFDADVPYDTITVTKTN